MSTAKTEVLGFLSFSVRTVAHLRSRQHRVHAARIAVKGHPARVFSRMTTEGQAEETVA